MKTKQKKGSYRVLKPAELERALPVINPKLMSNNKLKVTPDGRIMSIPEEFCPPLKKRAKQKATYKVLKPAEVGRARPQVNPTLMRNSLKVSADGRIMSIPEEFCPPLKKKTGR